MSYSQDFDQQFLDNIRAVTTSDIKDVANTRWNFNEFVLVLVGPKSALQSLEAAQSRLPAPLNTDKIRFGRFDEVLKIQK